MAKLGNFFRGNGIVITQSPHGEAQGYKAIDCKSSIPGDYDILAPCDLEVKNQVEINKDRGILTPYFQGFNNNFKLEFVHARMTGNAGLYKKGMKIGTYKIPDDPYPDHLHVAIATTTGWNHILEYIDRSISLSLSAGFNSQHWKNWTTWADKQLNIITLFPAPTPPPKPKPTPAMDYRLYKHGNNLQAEITKGGFVGRIKVERMSGPRKGTFIENINIDRPNGGKGGPLVVNMEPIQYKVIFPGNHKTYNNEPPKPAPKPAPPPPDNLYRVKEGGKVILTTEHKDTAFNAWYNDKSRTVDYNGVDIISDFIKIENILNREIGKLRGDLAKLEDKYEGLEIRLAELNKANARLNQSIKALKAENFRLRHEATKTIFVKFFDWLRKWKQK